jgi:acyl carrier protein
VPSINFVPRIVEEAVVDAIAKFGPSPRDIKPDASFEALGVDSLDLVEIAQMAEEKWGANVEPQDMGNVKTVGEAIDLIVARIP